MMYFKISSVRNAYESVSKTTKDKFWGILAILYSLDREVLPNVIYSINTSKLSTFLENTFRLRNKKNYEHTASEYSVVFSQAWHFKVSEYFLNGKPDILPIIIWAYRQRGFNSALSTQQLFELFINDFHLSRDFIEEVFKVNLGDDIIEYSDFTYSDNELFKIIGGKTSGEMSTVKMNKSFVVANAGDLSRGPFFQPLYASLNTLECLIIFPFDVNEYYNVFSKNNKLSLSHNRWEQNQVIYYGAPGTGKSNKIEEYTNDSNRVRTTFHPDSDYSTFVGAYKPTMEETGVTVAGKKETRIAYKYVPQAFLKAYVNAWEINNGEECTPFYLIIEEINRGNCAQIFGDLFQLLDRGDNGESKYAISPDDDIKRFLADEFKESVHLPEMIKNGEEMRLPSNLYIWATMNTSDQSLFPIDSAFKRRWDWEYIPIVDGKKNFVIEVGNNKYDWLSFIETINSKIDEITGSEDKKLGYWFAKPAGEGSIISCNQFVSKVLFYLWNDVYKDYVDDNRSIFRIKEGNGTKRVVFTEFFGSGLEEKLGIYAKNGW
ncbi:MAG: McrB family protein [Bacteroidales bacterium]